MHVARAHVSASLSENASTWTVERYIVAGVSWQYSCSSGGSSSSRVVYPGGSVIATQLLASDALEECTTLTSVAHRLGSRTPMLKTSGPTHGPEGPVTHSLELGSHMASALQVPVDEKRLSQQRSPTSPQPPHTSKERESSHSQVSPVAHPRDELLQQCSPVCPQLTHIPLWHSELAS